MVNKSMKKMFDIISHQRNANQNRNEIAILKKSDKNKC